MLITKMQLKKKIRRARKVIMLIKTCEVEKKDWKCLVSRTGKLVQLLVKAVKLKRKIGKVSTVSVLVRKDAKVKEKVGTVSMLVRKDAKVKEKDWKSWYC